MKHNGFNLVFFIFLRMVVLRNGLLALVMEITLDNDHEDSWPMGETTCVSLASRANSDNLVLFSY